jgi:hypothetical protein
MLDLDLLVPPALLVHQTVAEILVHPLIQLEHRRFQFLILVFLELLFLGQLIRRGHHPNTPNTFRASHFNYQFF